MLTGTVIWWDSERGFGFLSDDTSEAEHFCHYTAVVEKDADGRRNLRKDQRVTYELGEGRDGRPQATDVYA